MRPTLAFSVLLVLVVTACSATGAAPESVPTGGASPTALLPGFLEEQPRTPPPADVPRLRLVTIGDSYTYGQGVARRDSWPNQLVSVLDPVIPIELAFNLADISKTSDDVIVEQLERVRTYEPDVVTLQIGANDVLSPKVSLDEYRTNVAAILEALLADLPPERVFVIAIPDFTLTPFGKTYVGPEANSATVAEANAILREEAVGRGVAYIDISAISDSVPDDPTLVSFNGLHPSEKQYAGWVELIAPRIMAAFSGSGP